MQILIGFSILGVSAFAGAVLVIGYPTTLKIIALAVYRHACKTERMQHRHASNVIEQWSRELAVEE
jgi:hypothetical protein